MSCKKCRNIPAAHAKYIYDFLELTRKILRVETGVIFSVKEETSKICLVVNENKNIHLEDNMEFPIHNDSIFSRLLDNPGMLVFNDIEKEKIPDSFLPFGKKNIKSLIGAPIFQPDTKTFGFLCFFSEKTLDYNANLRELFNKLKDSIEKILEQVRDKKKLELNRKMVRFFAENENNIIYKITFNPKAKFEYINAAVEEMTGYSQDDFYNDPEFIFKVVFPEDRYLLSDLILNRHFSEKIVSRWIRKDGSIINVEQHNYAEFDDEGNLKAIEGIAHNITNKSNWEVRIRHLTTVLHGLREINRTIGGLKNQEKLLKEVCSILSENKSYSFTSIAVLDYSHTTVVDIYGEKSEEHSNLLRKHKNTIPSCFRWVLKHPGVLIIENPMENCECQFKELYGDCTIMLSPIEYDNRCYGIIKVALDKGILIDIEERGLLKEIAENIAYALRALELEEARQEAEKKALENEERYKRTLDSLMEGCIIIDREWKIRYMNDAVALQMDLNKADYIGSTLGPGLDHDFYTSPLLDALQTAIDTGKKQFFEYPMKSESGEQKWFDVRINPVPEGYFIMLLDITDRKKIEESLIANERKYKMIADFTYDWETFRDQNGKIAFLSPSFERITGYRCQDYLSGKVSLESLVYKEDISRVQDIFSRSLNREVFNDEEFRIVRSDKKIAHVSYSSQPVINENGDYLGFRSSIRDITKRITKKKQIKPKSKKK